MLYRFYALIFYLLIIMGIVGIFGGAFLVVWAIFSWSKIIGYILMGLIAIYVGAVLIKVVEKLIDQTNKKLGDK